MGYTARHAIVVARCKKGCRRVIHPNEMPATSIPLCEKHHRIMVAQQVLGCDCDWTPPKPVG